MDDNQEIIREFLIESNDNLSRLDREMVELEQRPEDPDLLASIFRTIHTIKGTCGFLGFSGLEGITHLAENILSQLRNRERGLTPELVTLILESVDAIRVELDAIERQGAESSQDRTALLNRLQAATLKSPAPVEALDPPSPGTDAGSTSPAASAQKVASVADSSIRVDVGLLDKLMNLVGELVLTRNQILQFNAILNSSALNATSQHLNLITTELQEGVMKTRMQPIGVVWNKLPRLVRDLAAQFGKQIQLETQGDDTELDKTIIEAIKDPLTHIVRNCCDHGIELPANRLAAGKCAQARLSLKAFHEGGQVNIEISDDGAGIDVERVKDNAIRKGVLLPESARHLSEREALNLIFLPGLSTAQKVTSVSGRGVGMDVVRTNIEKIGGMVDLVSRRGEGTTVKLKIPLTLAIIPGLVVTSGGERFVIPQVSLLELIRLEGEAGRKQIEWIHGTPVYRRRGNLLPIAYLNQVLGLDCGTAADVINIIVLQAEDSQFGLIVDGISDTQEIVVKPLGKQLKGLTSYAGATIMGDGRVALILDVMGIGQLSGVVQEAAEHALGGAGQKDEATSDRQSFLLFRAGSFDRLAVPLSLVARLEELPQSRIERAGGRAVAQYRGRILPIAPLGPILEPGSADSASRNDPAQVIVFSDRDRSVGIEVDEILDIAEETIAIRHEASRPGLLGSAVIGKKITDFLDLPSVISKIDEFWFSSQQGAPARRTTVLVAEGASFSRGLVRNYLEMAGHRVIEAATTEQALQELGKRKIDVLMAALDLPPEGGAGLLDCMRNNQELAGIPAIALAGQSEELEGPSPGRPRFEEYQMKFDREGMLRSILHLVTAVGTEPATPAGQRV